MEESGVRKMSECLIIEMEEFAMRVLKGGENVTPQETAILPEILKMIEINLQKGG